MLRSAATDAFVLSDQRRERRYRRVKVPAFKRHEPPAQRRKVGAGGVATRARQILHQARAKTKRAVIAQNRLGQDDMQIGEPGTRTRQSAGPKVIYRAPGGGVARMARQLRTPQERCAVGHLLLRPAAVPVQRDGVAILPQCLRPVASPEFEQGKMPAQMAVESPVAWIGCQPGRQETAAGLRFATLVTDMGETMRGVSVFPVQHHGSLDFRASSGELTILGEGGGVIGEEPIIVAVMRGETVHQYRDLTLLADAAGAADQAVRIGGAGDHQRVTRPCRQMGVQGGDRVVGSPRECEVEEPDMPRFAFRQIGCRVLGCREGCAGLDGFAFPHQDLRLAGMRKGEAGIGGQSAVKGLDRTRIERQRQIVALPVGVPRGAGGGGERKVVAV